MSLNWRIALVERHSGVLAATRSLVAATRVGLAVQKYLR